MKPKVIAHLGKLFPQLAGINLEYLHLFGAPSISAMIDYVRKSEGELIAEIEKEENSLREAASQTRNREEVDVMQITQISTKVAYLQVALGNKKITISALKTVLGNMKQDSPERSFPVLPILRDEKYFKTGDDVMVYVGPLPENIWHQSPKAATQYHWVAAKVINYPRSLKHPHVDVFCVNRAYEYGALQGHAGRFLASMPHIFRREEFLEIKRLVRLEKFPDYNQAFFKSSLIKPETFRDPRRGGNSSSLKKLILDENVEPLTDDQLVEKTPAVVAEFFRLSEGDMVYGGYAHSLRQMLK